MKKQNTILDVPGVDVSAEDIAALYVAAVRYLRERLNSGNATTRELSLAIKFLKDYIVLDSPKPPKPVDVLKFLPDLSELEFQNPWVMHKRGKNFFSV